MLKNINEFIVDFNDSNKQSSLPEAPQVLLADIFRDRSAEDRMRPLEFLQLSKPTINALNKQAIRSVGECFDIRHNVQALKQRAVDELLDKFSILEEYIEPESQQIQWTQYANDPQIGIRYPYLTSPEINRLHPDEENKDISNLHFQKAHTPLRDAGYNTLSGFREALANGATGSLQNCGPKAKEEILQAAVSLTQAIDQLGNVDWVKYAKSQKLEVIPVGGEWNGIPTQLINVFPELICRAIKSTEKPRDYEIVKARLINSKDNWQTLDSIGKRHNLTRERIRQIEEKALNRIKSALLKTSYDKALFRFHPAIETLFQKTKDHFKNYGDRMWKASDWLQELATLWDTKQYKLATHRTLYRALLDYSERENPNKEGDYILYPSSLDTENRNQKFEQIDAIDYTLAEAAYPTTAEETLNTANLQIPDFPITEDEFDQLLDLVPALEYTNDALLQMPYEDLPTIGHQALRVLSRHGEPLHFRDIAAKMEDLNPSSSPALPDRSSTYLKHPELKPIGKSGMWALKSWGIETRTIAELAKALLTESGTVMLASDLAERIEELRPITKDSLSALLAQHSEKFISMGSGLWGLCGWDPTVPPPANLWTHQRIETFLAKYFKDRPNRIIQFDQLRREFEVASGLPTRKAVVALREHPRLQIEQKGTCLSCTFVELGHKIAKPARPQLPKGASWQMVTQWLNKYFKKNPDTSIPLATLVKTIEKETDTGRHIIYSVISRYDAVETIPIEGTHTKLCRWATEDSIIDSSPLPKGKNITQEPVQAPEIGTLEPSSEPEKTTFPEKHSIEQEISRFTYPDWKNELTRSLELLNPDFSDFALLGAGRTFDDALVKLIQIAIKTQKAPVDPYIDDQRLQTRIDWAVRVRLFDDSEELHLLRKERNKHSHSLTGQQKLQVWHTAPLLFKQYVRYIRLIENHIAAFFGKTPTPLLSTTA